MDKFFSVKKHKKWRKRIYKSVIRTAKVCLISYNACLYKHPDATNVELYTMVLNSRNYSEDAIEYILTNANSLADVVHLIAMQELPSGMDYFVKNPLKSRYDFLEDLEDKPKLVEIYGSVYEIVCSIIPEGI